MGVQMCMTIGGWHAVCQFVGMGWGVRVSCLIIPATARSCASYLPCGAERGSGAAYSTAWTTVVFA